MLWGCLSKLGLGPLVALEGSQNQHTHIEIVKEYVIPEIEEARKLTGGDRVSGHLNLNKSTVGVNRMQRFLQGLHFSSL
jgi:hypothetical protein